jgi:hypothetical protein
MYTLELGLQPSLRLCFEFGIHQLTANTALRLYLQKRRIPPRTCLAAVGLLVAGVVRIDLRTYSFTQNENSFFNSASCVLATSFPRFFLP